MPEIDPSDVQRAAAGLGTRDAGFLARVYGEGLDKYRRRLAAIGFEGLDRVLDAGCGFGQWSVALAETCGHVDGVDVSADRIRGATRVARPFANVTFQCAGLADLPFDDETFDAVLCYSTIYYTDVRRGVAEMARVLKPGGSIYICSNGAGWYLYNFVKQPYRSEDFHPRRYALSTLWATALYRTVGRAPRDGESIITSRRWLRRLLEQSGIDLIACDADATYTLRPDIVPDRFFRGRYWGLEGVSEWLGRKRPVRGESDRRREAAKSDPSQTRITEESREAA